jgi:hypothetical protein
VSPRLLLAACIYHLAHAVTYRTVRDLFGISASYFAETLPVFLSAILSALRSDPRSKLGMPSSTSEAQFEGAQWSSGTSASDVSFAPFSACVGAGDGCYVTIHDNTVMSMYRTLPLSEGLHRREYAGCMQT